MYLFDYDFKGILCYIVEKNIKSMGQSFNINYGYRCQGVKSLYYKL